MDWNRDGKIDGKDYALFHEVINKDSNSQSVSSGEQKTTGYGSRKTVHGKNQAPTPPAFEITQLGGVVLGILAFSVVAFIFTGSEFKAIWNLIEIGFIVFLIAQWLDS